MKKTISPQILFPPNKELGQNFLFDKNYLQKIVASCPIDNNTIIIEIGSGYGSLTNLLAATNCQQVITLSVFINYLTENKITLEVPQGVFTPSPSVDGAVVIIKPYEDIAKSKEQLGYSDKVRPQNLKPTEYFQLFLFWQEIKIHKANSKSCDDSFANKNLGYGLYQIFPFEYDEKYEKYEDAFKEAKKKILNSLSNYIKESSNKEEFSFVYYNYHDSRKGGIRTLSLTEYLKLVKQSKNLANYITHLRKAPESLEVINFETLFSLDKIKDFCNKYILCDASHNNFSKTKPRGTQDIYSPRSLIYQKIQQAATEILRKNNYQPIIFPTFEYKELFINSLGSTTDIIHKEMYTFLDRKGREMALRPEGTASTVRLVCQNKLITEGVELVNAQGVIADYQILKLVYDILRILGIKDFVFNLNYLGDSETKKRYKNELEKFIQFANPNFCALCQRRCKTNPLRILDCLFCVRKTSFPPYKDAWDKSDNNYVNELSQVLDKFNFPHQYDYSLVREVGDINAPAVGFAIGIERLADYLESSQLLEINKSVDVFFLATSPEIYLDILV
ncbi:1397_t:CDS:2 [Entrophospora sp. SA101]|nr:1397_t:CDS:2 [Entrophospora sp. SA101]